MRVGDVVRFKNPGNSDEASELFAVIELRGERVLVQALCAMQIKPQFAYLAADLTVA